MLTKIVWHARHGGRKVAFRTRRPFITESVAISSFNLKVRSGGNVKAGCTDQNVARMEAPIDGNCWEADLFICQ